MADLSEDQTGSQSVAAAANANTPTRVRLIQIIVGGGAKFKCTHFGNYANVVGAFGNLFWEIVCDGIVTRQGRIYDQIGLQYQPRELGEEAVAYNTFEVYVSNTSLTTAYTGGATIKGKHERNT